MTTPEIAPNEHVLAIIADLVKAQLLILEALAVPRFVVTDEAYSLVEVPRPMTAEES